MLDPSEGRRLYESERSTSERHLRARFVLDDGRELWFTDPRRFGEAFLIDDAGLEARFAQARGRAALARVHAAGAGGDGGGPHGAAEVVPARPVRVAGVGNIYADEALFRAELHPLSPAGSMKPEHLEALRDAVVAALEAGIDAGGSSIDDYRDARGEKGTMQDEFLVHTREGEACPRCGGAIVRIVVGGRSTYFCPSCQVQTARSRAEAPAGAVRSIVASVAGTTVKTEAVVLRSIRYGEADRILHLYSKTPRPDRGYRQGGAQTAIPLRRPPGAVLPARPDPPRRPRRPDDGDQRHHRRRLPAPALLRRRPHRRRPRLRRGAAPARLGRAQPARLQPALPLPGAARRPGARRAPPSLETALSFRLKLALVAGFAPELASCARCGEAEHLVGFSGAAGGVVCGGCEAGSFPLSRGGAPVHGRGAGEAAQPRRRRRSRGRCARSSAQLARRWSTTRTCSCAPPPRGAPGSLAASPRARSVCARHRHLRGPHPRLGGGVPLRRGDPVLSGAAARSRRPTARCGRRSSATATGSSTPSPSAG